MIGWYSSSLAGNVVRHLKASYKYSFASLPWLGWGEGLLCILIENVCFDWMKFRLRVTCKNPNRDLYLSKIAQYLKTWWTKNFENQQGWKPVFEKGYKMITYESYDII